MTLEHEKFLQWLETRAPFVAASVRGYWQKGRKAFIDSRVNVKGRRAEFNKLNRVMED